MPRVLPCVAASAIENGGFTDAMGDFESQVCERSMTRALAIAASRVCARESFAKADIVPQVRTNTTTTARQRASNNVTPSSRSGLNIGSSLAGNHAVARQSKSSEAQAQANIRFLPLTTIDSPGAARQNPPDGEGTCVR